MHAETLETIRHKNRLIEQIKETDFWMLTVTIALVMYGLIMVFSASYYFSINENGNPFYYLIRDGIWVILGTGLMCFGIMVDYRKWNNKTLILGMLAVCLMLLLVVFTPLGHTANNATRWIMVGPITIMPGEIAKMGMIFFIAWFCSENTRKIRSFTRGMLPILVVAGLFAALIIKQPNLSTAITLVGIVLVMMLVAGMRWIYIFVLTGAGAAGVMALILGVGGFWAERFNTFTHPFDYEATSGYQIVQGLQALGSGGLFGVGLGKSVTKSLYLPYPHNDFILAIIGEETGYIGVLVLLAMYAIFIWRGASIALRCQDEFGLLIASGTVMMVAIQVVLNLLVITSSMPATGVNLPFVSYGGNALMIFMFLAGVVLNISRHLPDERIEAMAEVQE